MVILISAGTIICFLEVGQMNSDYLFGVIDVELVAIVKSAFEKVNLNTL